jgi:RNA polymerase sigma-70 factor (ECF subfamily)
MPNLIETLFQDNYERLVLFATGYLHHAETAEDVVMSVFERILKHDDKLSFLGKDQEEEAKNYLFLVTKHRCLDHIRVQKNRLTIQGVLSFGYLKQDRNQSLDIFECEAIERMINVLGKQEARILQKHLDGFTNEEISQEIGISYNTVRNTLTNARKKIRLLWDTFMN